MFVGGYLEGGGGRSFCEGGGWIGDVVRIEVVVCWRIKVWVEGVFEIGSWRRG